MGALLLMNDPLPLINGRPVCALPGASDILHTIPFLLIKCILKRKEVS